MYPPCWPSSMGSAWVSGDHFQLEKNTQEQVNYEKNTEPIQNEDLTVPT